MILKTHFGIPRTMPKTGCTVIAVSDVFRRAGLIEERGRGTPRVIGMNKVIALTDQNPRRFRVRG